MWVNTPTIVIGRGPFFTLGPEGTYGPNGRPLVSDGELLMYRGLSSAGAGGNVFDLNAPDIRDGEWHHVCMIIDENITNKVMFYVDGVRFDNNDASPGGGATLGPLESTNIYFAPFLEANNNEFSLSHAAIFNNRILTDEDVLQIYNNGEPADLTGQSNLWGWWIFDGDFDDYSGNNRHLTKNGPVVFSENSPTTDYAYFNPSRVIQFNNNEPNYSSYGDLSGDENKDIWQLGFNFTVSAWFRTTDEDEDFMIVSWGNCGTNGTGGGDTRQLHINGSGNYKFEVCGGGTPNIDGNFDDNQWHHIVATVNENGTMIKSYLDGGNAINHTPGGSGSPTLQEIGVGANYNNLRVGMSHYDGHFMQGQVSNISIYDRVLTDEECNELWGNGKVTNISTLASYGSIKAWWQFDGNMKDSSPHNRHLTEVGTSDYQTIGSDIYV